LLVVFPLLPSLFSRQHVFFSSSFLQRFTGSVRHRRLQAHKPSPLCDREAAADERQRRVREKVTRFFSYERDVVAQREPEMLYYHSRYHVIFVAIVAAFWYGERLKEGSTLRQAEKDVVLMFSTRAMAMMSPLLLACRCPFITPLSTRRFIRSCFYSTLSTAAPLMSVHYASVFARFSPTRYRCRQTVFRCSLSMQQNAAHHAAEPR